MRSIANPLVLILMATSGLSQAASFTVTNAPQIGPTPLFFGFSLIFPATVIPSDATLVGVTLEVVSTTFIPPILLDNPFPDAVANGRVIISSLSNITSIRFADSSEYTGTLGQKIGEDIIFDSGPINPLPPRSSFTYPASVVTRSTGPIQLLDFSKFASGATVTGFSGLGATSGNAGLGIDFGSPTATINGQLIFQFETSTTPVPEPSFACSILIAIATLAALSRYR